MTDRRMTVARALTEFLAAQWTVDGDTRVRTVPGVLGIFGHGNVAGMGRALGEMQRDDPSRLPYRPARNEQAMVHQAVGFARVNRRRATLASTASVGPGSTNMLTGAALATTNRLPALLLPSDTFATRVADPVLQQLELPHDTGLTVNDAFRPLSRYFDRVDRPEQLFSIALAAMRVLTDPVETGAVTIALPQDVQTETLAVPAAFLAEREWHLRRPVPEPGALARAVQLIRSARRPVVVAGGGVVYAGAEAALAAFAAATGVPVATTQAGGGAILDDHPQSVGGVGATGSAAGNRLAADADVVIGIGTRYSDFTTASRTAFQDPSVAFVNVNVAPFDAHKLGASVALVADAREALAALAEALAGWRVPAGYAERVAAERDGWRDIVRLATAPTGRELPAQAEVIGAVQAELADRDVIVQAAGSLPGDLHKLWRVRDPLGYHVEYAYSCMGYEIAGGLGVKRGLVAQGDDREVVVLVGDGSYLMMNSELVTAVSEGLKLVVVLVQNQGYASIGRLSESVAGERFGTRARMLDVEGAEGSVIPLDLAANAESLGVDVIRVEPGAGVIERLRAAVAAARAAARTTLVHVETDPLPDAPDGEGWWDVPVPEPEAGDGAAAEAAERHARGRARQRPYL
ncbi:3D-(3,5/4)-trihydroxycyclohexane-1,2-dione acylhydrolase (decyclizing) [Agromyces silvae]|uniref:3D-(3,5/4)-trihydroxycyclohexane-1,2-dione acylhydrolase (decyclizing) n=1 Tax=Agromyces silvae TaxID=3388266 RepID=UPI00280BA75A|nr:3D-(3,5/4)-trihydroxycyclohexane-1,2-dione acylhydrolase (decyclizing) [Agromyces protaetiae]